MEREKNLSCLSILNKFVWFQPIKTHQLYIFIIIVSRDQHKNHMHMHKKTEMDTDTHYVCVRRPRAWQSMTDGLLNPIYIGKRGCMSREHPG